MASRRCNVSITIEMMGCKSSLVRIAVVVLTLPAVAAAQVLQTDEAGTALPQPVGGPEVSLITDSWGYSTATRVSVDAEGNDVFDLDYTFGHYYPTFVDGDAITLEGLFKWRGEAIDPVTDAQIAPGHFTPSCGFSVELVLRGTNCTLALGWYNIADPSSMTPPAADEIYELVPGNVTSLMHCRLDICPLAWDNVDPRQLDTEAWTPMTFDGSAILEDPLYGGGAIGLALIGDPEEACSANKYSLYGQNQKNSAGDAWVTALIYASTVSPGSFYLAFEDLPMSAEDWHETGSFGVSAMNDGDFNDFVYFVSVTDCSSSGAGGTGGAGNTGSGGGGSMGEGGDASVESGGSGGAGSTVAGTIGTNNTTGAGAVGSGGSDAGGSGGTTAEAGAAGELVCTPGRQLECTCTDGRKGAQVCTEQGDGFSPCNCSGASPKEDAGGCGCRLEAQKPTRGGLPWGAGFLLLALSRTIGRRLRLRHA